MDRPPPRPGPGAENPPTPSGRFAGEPDGARPPQHPRYPDSGDLPPEPHAATGPSPSDPSGSTEPGYLSAEQADPMPTVPIPRLPSADRPDRPVPGPEFPPVPRDATEPRPASAGTGGPEYPPHRQTGFGAGPAAVPGAFRSGAWSNAGPPAMPAGAADPGRTPPDTGSPHGRPPDASVHPRPPHAAESPQLSEGAADSYHLPYAPVDPPPGTGAEHLPPGPAGHPVTPPASGAPGDFASAAAEPPNAHYEGDWADWMMSSDGYPPRPGGETPGPYSTGTDSAPWNDGPPADDPGTAAVNPAAPGADATESHTGSVPTTARERLRARLTPSEMPAPPSATTRTAAAPGRNRLLPVLLGVAGVAALGAAAYVQFAVVGADAADPAPTAANPPVTAAPGAPGADPNCPAERVGNTVQGNGPGGTGSGTDAIFGFQHAYYVSRSGEQARAVVAPDAAVPSAADIQHGIDTIPPGTTHCLQITPGAFVGQYTVVVTEYRPGAAPIGYNPQLVTTMRIGDRTLITGIGPMP